MLQNSLITTTPWALALIAGCMILTRCYTEIRHAANMRMQSNSQKSSQVVTTIPYSIPWLGHTISFFTKPQPWLRQLGQQVNHGIFAVVLGGRKCHIIMSPGLAKEVLADDKGAIGAMDQTVLWGKIHRVVYQLNREPFLSQAGDIVHGNIEKSTLSLVSACYYNLKWQERAHVLVGHGGNEFEASFFPLIRHFVADMVLPSLYGTAFMKNYPDIAADLFEFDANFHFFLMGLPAWVPISGLKESAAARARVKSALEDFHNALVARSRGEAPDARWGSLNDVSSVMNDRVHFWEEAVGEHSSKEGYVSSHAFLLWVTLINANVIVFWLFFHIYEDSSLLTVICEEVSPFVHAQESQSNIKLDSAEIKSQTLFLRSAFLETMGLYTQSNSFKNVQADFTVTESDDPSNFATKGEQDNRSEHTSSSEET
ncbi:hypothetical protein BDW59DRAFT_158294 [Aspergillus cavernicola]|uniref:Cytochrome P450 n=1 Tax=Aspergillus cavernicola TaxID=176166 RepID=A0ABR4ISW2_9EURO